MAPTVTPQAVDPHSSTQASPMSIGDIKVTVSNIVFDATSYSAGGFAVTPANLGLSTVLFAIASQIGPSSGAVTGGVGEFVYNTSTGKIQVFNSTGVEGAPTTTLTGLTAQIIAFGY